MTDIADLISKELNRFAPELSSPELATHTAAIMQCNAYRVADGKLVPTSREAVASILHFAPAGFVRGVARDVADREVGGARKTLAYYAALGTGFEASLGNSIAHASGLTTDGVAQQLHADEVRGRRSLDIALAGVLARDGK